MVSSSPTVSIVIPIHNEAALLVAAVTELKDQLTELGVSCEIILAENGSSDATPELSRALAREHANIRVAHVDHPNYGLALRRGIEQARGDYVICDEIDLLDTGFYQLALGILQTQGADVVVGSKLSRGASDERPWPRHAASICYTLLLKGLVGFEGTDTHGLKAFRRAAMLPVVGTCQIDKDVFSSELLIRAHRSNLRVVEVPTRVREKRPPSIHLYRRIPSVCTNLLKLTWSIRFNRGKV